MKNVHRFSDFANDNILDGEKKRLSEILNQEIIVTSKKNSGECLKLQYEIDGKKYVTFTGSVVLIKQCKENKDQMPFVTVIKQVGKYYSFT